MVKHKPDLLQGTLDMLILKTLALGPRYGWGISQRIQQVSGKVLQVNQGSLYPALHRLEQRGWLRSSWGSSENNRQAKFYALTRTGRRQLEQESRHWARLSTAVARIMEATCCGKLTLLSILGLLDTPSDGRYQLNGQSVANLKMSEPARTRNREIGFIFQSFNLIGALSVYENVELPLTYRGMRPAERKERVTDALEKVDMAHRAKHLPSSSRVASSSGRRRPRRVWAALDPARRRADRQPRRRTAGRSWNCSPGCTPMERRFAW